jgi:hypothetical protein
MPFSAIRLAGDACEGRRVAHGTRARVARRTCRKAERVEICAARMHAAQANARNMKAIAIDGEIDVAEQLGAGNDRRARERVVSRERRGVRHRQCQQDEQTYRHATDPSSKRVD